MHSVLCQSSIQELIGFFKIPFLRFTGTKVLIRITRDESKKKINRVRDRAVASFAVKKFPAVRPQPQPHSVLLLK